MPEGPEVKTVANALKSLINLTLTHYEISDTYKYSSKRFDPNKRQFPGKIPGSELVKLPMKLMTIGYKGKHIFFVYSDSDNKIWYLESTLGLHGAYSWKEIKHTKIIFHFVDNTSDTPIETKLYFSDKLSYGNFNFWNFDQYVKKTNTIGKDLLSEDVSLEEFVSKIKSYPNKQICVFLMDQSYFSGVGNYLKSEILYRAKIRPDRLCKNLSEEEISLLHKETLATIKESYEHGGLSVYTFLSVGGERGEFNRLVYNRDVDPLGNKVVKMKFLDRGMSHVVMEIQK